MLTVVLVFLLAAIVAAVMLRRWARRRSGLR